MNNTTAKLGMAMFIILTSVSKHDIPGKRLKKKIERALKKRIKIFGQELNDEPFYNLLVNHADKATDVAKEKMTLEEIGKLGNVPINPGLLILMAEKKEPGFLKEFGINEEDAEEYSALFTHHKLTFLTAMYINRLYAAIYEGEVPTMSKETIESQIQHYEGIQKSLLDDIRAKQEEIDNYEEDDTTAEQEELDILNERLDEVNEIIEQFEEKLQEVS